MDPQEMLENPGRSSASCGATIRSRLVMLFPAGLGTHRWRDPPLCLASPELLPTSGGAGSSCMVVARPLCPVARFDFPHDRGSRASDRASGDGKVGGDGHIADGFTEDDIPF